MDTIKLPYYWKDELKDILFEQGFDKVVERIEQMITEQGIAIMDDRVKPL